MKAERRKISRAPVVIVKICTVVLGIVILVLGWYSHFESDWIKAPPYPIFHKYFLKLYHICDYIECHECPEISMEHYFISVVCVTFVLSLFGFVVFCHAVEDRRLWRLLDVGYHVIGALLLLAGAVVYIMSAEQIEGITFLLKDDSEQQLHSKSPQDGTEDSAWPYLKRLEKLAAAILTIIQAVLFLLAAVLIPRGRADMESLR